MCKNLILFLFSIVPVALFAQTTALQTMYVAFGATTTGPDANSHYWNNVLSAGSLALVNSANTSTGYNITYTSGSFILNTTGVGLKNPTVGNLGDLAVAFADSNLFYFTGATGTTGTFTISGLSPAKGYKFYLFGSRVTGSGSVRSTTYTLNGGLNGTVSTSGTVQTSGQVSSPYQNTNIVDTLAMIPNASGVITLNIAIAAGGFAYLNCMKIDEVSRKFFNKSTGNLDNTANWGSNTDGSGSTPQSFTLDSTTYGIRNGSTPTLGANWTVSGTGSKVYLGDTSNTINFTIPSAYSMTGTINVNSAATLTNQNTTNPTLGTLYGYNTILFNGSSPQTIPAANYFNLRVNNTAGASISGPATVSSLLGLLGGTLTTNNNLTLKSTSINSTTFVEQVTSGAGITGNVTIERYIPASQRSFRFLTPGVTSSSSIKANWQEGASSSTANPNAGYGTHITGSTTDQTNGFDGTATGNPSLFTFNNGTQSWSAVSNTNTNTLTSGVGYRILIRGDRSISLTSNTPTPTATTIRSTGTLVTGTVVLNTSSTPALSNSTNDYNFIGNPYWCPVNWSAVGKSNVSGTYWLWDPTRAGTNNRGAYTSYTIGTGASGGGAINGYLQPGQAFFVQTTGASPTLTFTEANKAASSSNLTTTFGEAKQKPRINVELYVGNNAASADATAVVFDNNFKRTVSDEDASKMTNPDENIAVKVGNSILGIEGRPLQVGQDTIQLNWSNLLASSYQLKVNAQNFASLNSEVKLKDNYTNTVYSIDSLGNSAVIPIAVTSDLASKDPNRFTLILSTKLANVPVIQPVSFGAKLLTNPVKDAINLQVNNPDGKALSIKVTSASGKIVLNKNIGNATSQSVALPTNITGKGIYIVEVSDGNNRTTLKAVKE